MNTRRLICMAALLAASMLALSGCGGGSSGGSSGTQQPTGSFVTLIGRIIDAAARDSGISGAFISLTPLSRDGSPTRATITATTDEVGAYRMVSVPVGPVKIRIAVNDAKFKAIDIGLDIPGGFPTASLTATLVPNTANPSGITISPDSPTLSLGDTVRFTATVAGGTTLTPFFTATGDAGIISMDGVFTAVKEGSAVITTQIGALTASTNVTVSGSAVTGAVFGVVRMDYRPVADFTVPIGSMNAVTGTDGSYVQSGLPPGTYTVSFTRGVKTFTRIITVGRGASTRLDIDLEMLGQGEIPGQPTFRGLF